jgi:hypothetical protein
MTLTQYEEAFDTQDTYKLDKMAREFSAKRKPFSFYDTQGDLGSIDSRGVSMFTPEREEKPPSIFSEASDISSLALTAKKSHIDHEHIMNCDECQAHLRKLLNDDKKEHFAPSNKEDNVLFMMMIGIVLILIIDILFK